MELVADLADRYGTGEVRVTHEQNLVLPDVRERDLHELWQSARAARLATPTVGLLGDIISCPGGDLCSLANAKTLPIAEAILTRFEDLDYQHDIGELDLNMSGCMNSCGHHHVGHIGILGVDKNGSEWYQVTIGGRQGRDAAIGRVIGPSFAAAEMPEVVEKLLETYLAHRHDGERFVETVDRIGIAPFKERVYGAAKEVARAA
jgi:sulfite reductase (NADPH) hemoprotein beta-component